MQYENNSNSSCGDKSGRFVVRFVNSQESTSDSEVAIDGISLISSLVATQPQFLAHNTRICMIDLGDKVCV